jgi:hypothetical protein
MEEGMAGSVCQTFKISLDNAGLLIEGLMSAIGTTRRPFMIGIAALLSARGFRNNNQIR